MRDKYSRDEVAALFDKVNPEPPAYTADEVREAGELAGFSPEEIEASASRLDRDEARRRHLQIAGGVLIAVFASIIFGPSIAGTPIDTLPIHNEHRSVAFDVEVLVPSAPARDCTVPPDARHDASTYCIARRQNLLPRDRTRIGLSNFQDACPQVWIRTFVDGELSRSNVFELPASVEIENSKSLDQKGLGAPNMYGSPIGNINHAMVMCGGAK